MGDISGRGGGTTPPARPILKTRASTPDTPCPVVWRAPLLIVSEDGIARCFDASTGEAKWKERLPGGG